MITDRELNEIRQRTGGPVAEQVNRLLKLGSYAHKDVESTFNLQRFDKLVTALPEAVKQLTVPELQELMPVLEKAVQTSQQRTHSATDAAPRSGSLFRLLSDYEMGEVPELE